MANSSQTRFVWCDLEMTGLDPEKNVIIEMGLVITGLILQITWESWKTVRGAA